MSLDIWNIFHDGVISNLKGSIPGNVNILVEIEYLRNMFPGSGSGSGFNVHLSGCTQCEFEEYDQAPISDFAGIVKIEPVILSAEDSVLPMIINCTMGVLRLAYQSATVTLDSGEPVSNHELSEACARYWHEWEQSWKERS